MSDTMETTLLVKQEAFVFKIPTQQSSAVGFKANGWALDKPEWSGKLKLVGQGKQCCIKLEEKGSGKVYAECPVDAYPGPAVQSVSDSSRYFVLRIKDGSGRTSHVGLGFADRSDSFDLNVALQDHFKNVRLEEAIEEEEARPQEQLDLAFKEGETIKVNINIPRKSKGNRERSRSPATGMSKPGNLQPGALPPPTNSTAAAMSAAGIKVTSEPRLAAPPAKQNNPNWIQF